MAKYLKKLYWANTNRKNMKPILRYLLLGTFVDVNLLANCNSDLFKSKYEYTYNAIFGKIVIMFFQLNFLFLQYVFFYSYIDYIKCHYPNAMTKEGFENFIGVFCCDMRRKLWKKNPNLIFTVQGRCLKSRIAKEQSNNNYLNKSDNKIIEIDNENDISPVFNQPETSLSPGNFMANLNTNFMNYNAPNFPKNQISDGFYIYQS